MSANFLTALPVYNEVKHVNDVLDEVLRYSPHVLVVDDGSTDGTAELLAARTDVDRVTHQRNIGYGAALRSAFAYTLDHGYDVLVTIDCDGQHEPQRIREFVAAASRAPIISGSRYLQTFSGESAPPADRRRINHEITAELNRRLGLNLTDAFCGFKAYRRDGAGATAHHRAGLRHAAGSLGASGTSRACRSSSCPCRLIYLDESRSFGGSLDDANTRLQYYYEVLDRVIARAKVPPHGRAKSTCRGAAG